MYRLIIETDSKTKDFIRELILYSFGKLAYETGDYTAYSKPFWDSVVCKGIDTYENYLRLSNNNKRLNIYDKILSEIKKLKPMISKDEIELIDDCDRIQKYIEIRHVSHLYDYLEYSIVNVGNREINTFYNVYGDSGKSICVNLKERLPRHYEKMVIDRITDFFHYDIYEKITDYDYICSFSSYKRAEHNHDKFILKRIYLIDDNEKIIKILYS